jgi:hypothetical protein
MVDVNGAAAKPRRFHCMSKATAGSPPSIQGARGGDGQFHGLNISNHKAAFAKGAQTS